MTTKAKLPILTDLFLTFFRIGLFTFGGGYAMISLINNSCVEKKKWIDRDEMVNLTVIAESTPGSIAINFATYVGYKQAGFAGALLSTIGVVLPSFFIIFAISRFLDNFLEIPFIAKAFHGIKLAVGILILDAGINMIKIMKKRVFTVTVIICSFLAMLIIDIFSVDISTITLLLIAALSGLIFTRFSDNFGNSKKSGQK